MNINNRRFKTFLNISPLVMLVVISTLSSCSHMDDMSNLVTGKDPRAIESWQNLPIRIQNYLSGNNPVKGADERQIDIEMKYIVQDGKCFGPDGKKTESNKLCDDIIDLISKVKTAHNSATSLRKNTVAKGVFAGRTISDAMFSCVEEGEEYNEDRHTHESLSIMTYCGPFLSEYLSTVPKKSDLIRNHSRASLLKLDDFDYFYQVAKVSENRVKAVLAKITVLEQKLRLNHEKNKNEPNWNFYCQYLEAYHKADDLIRSAPTEQRKQKLRNDKAGMGEAISQIRSLYKKNTGRALDESKCKK